MTIILIFPFGESNRREWSMYSQHEIQKWEKNKFCTLSILISITPPFCHLISSLRFIPSFKHSFSFISTQLLKSHNKNSFVYIRIHICAWKLPVTVNNYLKTFAKFKQVINIIAFTLMYHKNRDIFITRYSKINTE